MSRLNWFQCKICKVLYSTECAIKNHVASHDKMSGKNDDGSKNWEQVSLKDAKIRLNLLNSDDNDISKERMRCSQKEPDMGTECSLYPIFPLLGESLWNNQGKSSGEMGEYVEFEMEDAEPFEFAPESNFMLPEKLAQVRKGTRKKEKKRHICPYCGSEKRDTFNLNLHIRIHTGIKPFSCRTCGLKYVGKQGLQRHESTCSTLSEADRRKWASKRRKLLKVTSTKQPDGLPEQPNLVIESCYSIAEGRTQSVDSNSSSSSLPKTFDSSLRSFINIGSIPGFPNLSVEKLSKTEAAERQSGDCENKRNVQNNHKCPQCPETFLLRNTLRDHEMEHGTRHQCDICFAGFNTKKSLDRHRQRQHLILEKQKEESPLPLKCPFCLGIYQNECSLNSHLASKHRELTRSKTERHLIVSNLGSGRPWNFCSKIQIFSIGKKTSRARHKCPQCCEVFGDKTEMQEHLECHGTGFECKYCTGRFAVLSHLSDHVQRSHRSSKSLKRKKSRLTKPKQIDSNRSSTESSFSTDCVKLEQDELSIEDNWVIVDTNFNT